MYCAIQTIMIIGGTVECDDWVSCGTLCDDFHIPGSRHILSLFIISLHHCPFYRLLETSLCFRKFFDFDLFLNFLVARYSKLHRYKRSLGQSPGMIIGELIVYSHSTSWKWYARIWFCLYGREWPYSQQYSWTFVFRLIFLSE